jgi:hypothetical protein
MPAFLLASHFAMPQQSEEVLAKEFFNTLECSRKFGRLEFPEVWPMEGCVRISDGAH